MSSNRLVRVLPFVLLVGLVLVSIPGITYDPLSDVQVTASDVVWMIGFLAFPIVGAVLARRFPRNAVGWLFIVGPMLIVSGVSLMEYSEAVDNPSLSALGDDLFGWGFIAVASALLVFPDGRYPTRLFMILHPLLLVGALIVANETVDGWLLGGIVLLSVAGLIYRFVRGGRDMRRQMTPLILVVGLAVFFLFVVTPLIPDSTDPTVEVAFWVPWIEVLFFWVLSVGMPVAIALSITRYRLYEIDRIVSRTISYSLVVGALVLIFAALAVWIPQGLGLDDPLFVAGATLAAAALFNPLRKTVQSRVDRRFNRSKYDAERVAALFTETLKNQVNAKDLVDGWVSVVSGIMEPANAGVWVKETP